MACECHDIGMSRWCTVTSCHAMSHCHFHCHEMSLLNEKMSFSVVPSPLFISSYLPSSHESLPHLISSLLKTIPCDITSYFLFSYQAWLYLSRRTSWHLISIACPYLISMPGSLHDPRQQRTVRAAAATSNIHAAPSLRSAKTGTQLNLPLQNRDT